MTKRNKTWWGHVANRQRRKKEKADMDRVNWGCAKVLLFLRGRGSGHAQLGGEIARRLAERTGINVLLASYGTGNAVLCQLGHVPFDLQLQDNNPFAETLVRSAKLVASVCPDVVLSHEEFAAMPAAKSFGLPTVFLTDWFTQPDDIWMDCLTCADRVIYLDSPGHCSEPPQVGGRVEYLGPIHRSFSLDRPDRAGCRRQLSIPADAVVISLFISPGRRTESIAPIADILLQAFNLLPLPQKLLLWPTCDDADLITKLQQTKLPICFLSEDVPFDWIMSASDLGITKGNRNIALELEALGIPSVSLSHGLNVIDDMRTAQIPTNMTFHTASVSPVLLADCMTKMITLGSRSGTATATSRDLGGLISVVDALANSIASLSPKVPLYR